MSRPVQALIHLAALRHNARQVRACASRQRVMAAVKANGYGCGAVIVAQTLADMVDGFAVCSLEEALTLREAGITQPILLLEGFFEPEELATIAEQHLDIVIHSPRQLAQLFRATLPEPVSVWLKVDSGMNRLGFNRKDFEEAFKLLNQCPQAIAPIRLMSHLACADDPANPMTDLQTKRFLEMARVVNGEASLANSAGIMHWPQTHADWVRPGIMLYGATPMLNSVAAEADLQAVMCLQSRLISVRQCQVGDTVGYGATFRCQQAMPVGVVAVGYGDGYPRHAPTGTPVLVNGKRVPLIGRVSMDMITVDLRSQPNARAGDPVELWGTALPVEEIAALIGTISYELLCGVSARVPRIVVGAQS